MRIAARLGWVWCLCVMVGILTNIWLSTSALQDFNDDALEAHHHYLLRILANTLETNLLIGQEIDQMGLLQALIEREYMDAAEVLAIDIYSAAGVILYSTELSTRGSSAPQAWLSQSQQSGSWHIFTSHEIVTGMNIYDDIHHFAAGIVITTLRDETPGLWEMKAESIVNGTVLTVISVIIAALVAYLAAHMLLRPHRRVTRILTEQENPARLADDNCVLSQCALEFINRHCARRDELQRDMSILEELDNVR